jgi:hypothetical protein
MRNPLPISMLLLWPALAIAQPAKPIRTPQSTAILALEDCRKLSSEDQKQTRYLTLYGLPDAELETVFKVLSFHCNTLSTQPDIVRPRLVAGSGGTLLAIALDDYGWDAKVWERLRHVDPYFHVQVTVRQEKDQNGETWDITNGIAAPWLETDSIAALIALTKSQVPIVRGDWFLWQTGAQAERNPGYYDFLGIKDRKNFHELVGLDEKLLDRFPKKLREAVSDSGVTQQPRRIDRLGTIGGGLWITSDVRAAEGKKNPLRILEEEYEPDAHEEFAHMPNGLWAFGLFDDQGGRQDNAPDFIGFDHTSHNNDGRIHVGVSCIRCHGPTGGINDIDGWGRGLFKGKLDLKSADRDTARRLRRLYLSPLEDSIEDDRRVYTRAVKRCNDWGTDQNARQYGNAWAVYDSPVNAERAAADLGVSKQEWINAIDARIKRSGSIDDITLGAFLVDKNVPLRTWHESIGLAHSYLVKGERR